jgi:signal transduction histidine kinase
MIRKLYKKLYFYTFLILITAIILTAASVHLITRQNVQGSLESRLDAHLSAIKIVLRQTLANEPAKLNNMIKDLEKETNWSISLWKDKKCISNCNEVHGALQNHEMFNKLLTEKSTQVIHSKVKGPVILTYLSKSNPSKGFIIVSRNDLPPQPSNIKEVFINTLFILLFLALLLVPYTKYVLQPFKELMRSINLISNGNFNNIIPVNQKSEFKEIAEAFNNMTVKIQETVTLKQRLITAVSHELKTPLAKVRIALELLLNEGKGNRKYINRSIVETENLDKLINELLDASELEINPDQYKLIKTDFKEILNENLEKYQPVFDQNGLILNKTFSENPLNVKVDRLLMERVFYNIFTNVIKYAPQNSNIEISLKPKNDMAFLSVTNYGPGVEKKHLEKIFEPFYRPDSSRTRGTGGTGLGLSLVKKITELHGGKVWAASPVNNENGFVMNLEIALCS